MKISEEYLIRICISYTDSGKIKNVYIQMTKL